MSAVSPLVDRFGRCLLLVFSVISLTACQQAPAATARVAKKLPSIALGQKGAFPLKAHLESADIAAGKYAPAAFIDSGADLFHTPFNGLDGVGASKGPKGILVNRFAP